MPHPNRSPSSPSLRDPPKQVSGELHLSRPSMSPSNPSPLRASVRRFPSRGARPTVASIADLFVGSLVLAGFCHEHSPRTRARSLSTLPLKKSEHHLQRFRCKAMANRGQLPVGERWEYTGSVAQPSRARSWLSTASAPAAENLTTENRATKREEEDQKSGGGDFSMRSGSTDSATKKSRQTWLQTFDTIVGSKRLVIQQKGPCVTRPDSQISIEEISTQLSTPDDELRLSFDQKRYILNANLYKRILGDENNWTEPMDIVFPKEDVLEKTKIEVRADDAVDPHQSPSVTRLVDVLNGDDPPSTQHLFRLYRDIPVPGVAKLSKRSRGDLLRRFANPPDRRWADARRYLALVQDMVAADLPMSRSLWTSAIYFAGRGNGSGRVMKRDLVRAIGIWQQMEHVAGLQSDDVVFNILFDVAIKAGQFTVANRLEEERIKRGIGFSRFGLISRIYSFGLRKDLDKISRTFEEFVQSGELVDTVVLNSLCASFLRAGDTVAAEALVADPSPLDHALSSEFGEYRKSARKLGRLLKHSKVLKHRLPDHHRVLQNSLSMAPDTRTFYIFLRYYAHQSGQFDQFIAVLRDMEDTYTVPPRNIIYMLLFEGFALHGDRKRSWSAERLRQTWHAYLRALRESRSRFDAQHSRRALPKTVWENPLGNTVNKEAGLDLPVNDAPDGFYMPLPSASPATSPTLNLTSHPEDTREPGQAPTYAAFDGQELGKDPHAAAHSSPDGLLEHEDLEEDEIPGVDEFFTSSSPSSAPSRLGLVPPGQHRLENGVFVGRKMIVVILRAFGACCGPKEVLEVWLQLERLWHPHHRKAMDVLAIKEELDHQLSKGPPRT
ncbi:hypothetical protein N7462_009298 [Penicillium macrosclerotiorum]|uniref:uncharacterized protein n=1 Tax=Penicillium macrosclerotiorum TaxID=303699 RepID=UPI002547B795|nr:uncharacterized protein N7462_009298 [Penicillium macrosclerotiorum]KAJ5673859.1 hypothetical protein N7462_009298 [Penicillium macrosclerotiorum]